MPNITWNPSDKSAGVTLSNGNLTATGSGNGGVRGTSVISTGKFYWECTITAYGGGTPEIGICSATATLLANTTAEYAIVQYGTSFGQIYNNGANLANIGYPGVGGTYCMAVDTGAKLIWFRNGAAGNWNNSGTANPATGVGGASFSSMSSAPYAFYAPAFGTDTVVLNSGDSAFVGAVPAGYTSGVPVSTGGGGGKPMSFVTSSAYSNIASGPLPLMTDIGGSSQFAQCSFSHMRIIGAGTVTFDSGQVATGSSSLDTIIGIPLAARSIVIAGGTPTVQLGKMD